MQSTSPITISQLLQVLPQGSYTFQGDESQVIDFLTWDYATVKKNSLYFCIEEEEFQENHIETNSFDYWQTAVKSGAVCLLTKKGRIQDPPANVSLIETDQLNQTMALIARTFNGDPLKDMNLIGITGTNGKTTTSQLIDSILIEAENKTGVIGTIGHFYPSGKEEATHLSNPMANELFSIGKRMKEEGVNCLTMEVTSHAGAYDRNFALDFDVLVFSNLTQDHLDTHKTMEEYKKCKLRHFKQLGSREKKAYGIVNVDDSYGKEFVEVVDSHLRGTGKVEILTYGIRNKDADLVAYPKQMTGGFSEFDIFLKGNHLCQIHLPIPGLFNIYNSLAAFGATFALGISIDQIVEGLKKAMNVDGRFERVECDADYEVYVDYAHTPDSLEKILQEIRGITRRKVFAVFGCGGDRDRTKRPLMGSVAANIADVCIVTSDNPRSEDPQAIINDIIQGIPKDSHAKIIIEPDRREAIYAALEMASRDDSVLIAGKGHEDYQIIGKTKHYFLDRGVVKEFFKSEQIKSSRAWIEINRQAIKENFIALFEDKPEDLQIMAVVKDDAAGHGIVEMAEEAIAAGCSQLAVAYLSEAITLRRVFSEIPILIFGERQNEEIPRCVRQNFSIQVQSVGKARLIGDLSKKQRVETTIHFKVDTGMGRYGVRWDKAVEVFRELNQIEGIRIEGIMTHFAQSDEARKDYANLQWKRFNEVIETLKNEGMLPPLVHACNTGGYLDLPHAHGNMVRLGILPCGVYPSKVCRRIELNGKALKPAMRVLCRISFIKILQPGDCLGYGMHFTAERETKIAVLPIGYGDGYPRLRNKGFVLINGNRVPLVGGNAMDATMVDITGIEDVQAGDEVVLLGAQQGEEITAMQLADWAGTVTYQILAGWTRRIDRIYI